MRIRSAADLLPCPRVLAGPEHPAVIMGGTGETVTHGELEERSRRLAAALRSAGLRPGDGLALFAENHPKFMEVVYAAFRAGLHLTPINSHLAPAEAGYIISDSGAKGLVTSAALRPTVDRIPPDDTSGLTAFVQLDGEPGPPFQSYHSVLDGSPTDERTEEVEGALLMYSSGTTGRPKGIRRGLSGERFGVNSWMASMFQGLYGLAADTVYLSPAPLYHSAPIGFCFSTIWLGGTVVEMERFDPEAVLRLIERHKVTHVQFVPTHISRLLQLPEQVRNRYDLSSLRAVIHAAAPCPPHVKERAIDWWGPIVYEYYGGSEAVGLCALDSHEWLAHRGSVGRAIPGTPHILREDGSEADTGEVGRVAFEGGARLDYHGDPGKTAEAWDEHGWATIGDIGYLDADGYLYLTDRVGDTIITGGANVYPKEVEDVLITDPRVADVAVVGVPDEDLGQVVHAVVVTLPGVDAGPDLAGELIELCTTQLARFKRPRAVHFVDELPRLPTGKLLRRKLRETYGGARP